MVKRGIDENRLYSVTEACKILNVSRCTMEKIIKETPIEYVNLGGGRQYTSIRVFGSTILNFIEKSTVTGEIRPLYDFKAQKNASFRRLQGRR
jgi:excisionase family DNA binding protein